MLFNLITMRKLLLTIAALQIVLNCFGQVKMPPIPDSWKVKDRDGYISAWDSTTKVSGPASLRITGPATPDIKYLPFSQIVEIGVEKLSRININAFIKTKDVTGTATLWCQVWDENDKQIGFQNSQGQIGTISGTSDWKNYTMNLTVNASAKKLLIGGYLMGPGKAWFDDFSLTYVEPSNVPASKEVKEFANEVTNIVKTNSIYTDSLNWTQVEADLDELSYGLQTAAQASVLTDYILQQLRKAGDNHSFIQAKVAAQQYATKNSNPIPPEGKLIDNSIGYISVPGFLSTSDTAMRSFSRKIQTLIHELDTKNNIKGWIVDLRGNTGGNMWPMLAGLTPLTGAGPLGYFVQNVKGVESKNVWKTDVVKVKNAYKLKKPDTKIAVLIGPRTSSSGEMTTVAFIGRSNTRLFGQPTGGYTTANRTFALSDGSSLLLASSYVADRNQKKYLSKIIPDEMVTPQPGLDAEVKAAERWLFEK